jgi:acetyl esterase
LFATINALSTAPTPAKPMTPAEMRAAGNAGMEKNITAFYAPHAPLHETDHQVAVAGGTITVRRYSTAKSGLPLPCYLYFHGGGFMVGTLDHFDALCRATAKDANCVVISVDYRLAPEHKFPTAPEDCYAAFLWAVENSQSLNIDPARIAVGGMSAGGNLAAVVCLMARDRSGPTPVLQVLEVPVTDLSTFVPLSIPSEGIALPSGKARYAALYFHDLSEAANPYASPLLAPDLRHVPPALVMCAEYDELGPEGKAYATRLAETGIPVEFRCWEGQFHGSNSLEALIPEEAAAYHAQIVGALQRAFGN